MITPQEIQTKEFSRGVRGYTPEEVDAFLDEITLDYEKLLDENNRLKDSIKTQEKDLERYRTQESSILETLEAAKALMGDISASAEKRANILLKNAELDAELMQREAKESVERLTDENARLRAQYQDFRAKFKSMLEAEMLRIDSLANLDIFEEKDMEDLKKITEGEE